MFFGTSDLYDNEIYLRLEKKSKAKPARALAPAYIFTINRCLDNHIVGECDFRIGYTQKLYLGGNIGFRVYEPYRGNRYAAKACLLLCRLARKHNMAYFYITCNPNNFASRKTCEYAGGVLETIIDLPPDNDMLLEKGETQKCIYRFEL